MKIPAFVGVVISADHCRMLLGGELVHISAPFEAREHAVVWCQVVSRTNEDAGIMCGWEVVEHQANPDHIITRAMVEGRKRGE